MEMKFNFRAIPNCFKSLNVGFVPVSPEDLVVQVACSRLRALSRRFNDALEDHDDFELLCHHIGATFVGFKDVWRLLLY